MKALSLWQPWASLVAIGEKTIETRSWSTSYRGPLAIHASKWMPVRAGRGTSETWSKPIGEWRVRRVRIQQGPRLAREDLHLIKLDGMDMRVLPLGAVVGTCTLVDVVPIIEADSCEWHSEHPRSVGPCAHAAIDGQVILHQPDAVYHTTVLCELPYGDFSPGRYAWLLDDIEPLAEPVPARGRQGLWNWTPELT